MKINNILFIVIVLYGSMLSSCRKEDDKKTIEETEAENVVTIQLNTNATSDTIAFGEELHITGTVLGTQEMHGYELVLKNMMTDSVLFKTSEHDHATSYTIHGHWMNNLQNTSGLHITLVVEKDHDGNTLTKEVNLVGKGQ